MPTAAPLAVYYHTHWDREWYLPFRTYQLRLAPVVDDVLNRLESGNLPCFMLDGQTVVLEDYLELRPKNRNRLQALIRQGKLRIGPWYVMPDEFLVSGESLLRNLVQGIQDARAWGCNEFTGYLPDTFGHSADIPLLLQQCGIHSAVLWRGIHPERSLFQWQSPSGAQVRTLHLTDGYFQMMLNDWSLETRQKQDALNALIEKVNAARTPNIAPLLPIGGDHLALVPDDRRKLLLQAIPDIEETTPERYLASLPSTLPLKTIHGELADNSGSFLLPGVYSSRLYLKKANRQLEHFLTQRVEPLLAIAQAFLPDGAFRYPHEALALAWKTLILNHPHDSICGCSVDEVHRENEGRFDQVRQIAESLQHEAMHHLQQAFGKSDHWFVIHTGSQPYTGVIPVTEDALEASEPSALTQRYQSNVILQDDYRHDIHRIPQAHLTQQRRQGWIWANNVPALGIALIPKTGASSTASQSGASPKISTSPSGVAGFEPVSASAQQLQNEWLTVEIQGDGSLRVINRKSGQEYGPLLQFRDLPEQGDSYNSAPVPGHAPTAAVFQKARVIAAGPLVGIVELRFALPSLEVDFSTQVRLDAGSQLLQFETRFTNLARGHKLQVGFQTPSPVIAVQAESHFSIVERTYEPEYREVDHMPVAPWKELKTNTGPVQRFFSANGQSWITEGLTEYDVAQNSLYLTLLRTFDTISKGDTGVRGAQAGPPLPTPEGECLHRPQSFRYAWLPTPDTVSTLYESAANFYGNIWGESPIAESRLMAASHAATLPPPFKTSLQGPEALLHWDNAGLVQSACYWSPGNGLILRLLNPTASAIQTTVQSNIPVKQWERVNFLEEIQETLQSGKITVAPHGVITLRLRTENEHEKGTFA